MTARASGHETELDLTTLRFDFWSYRTGDAFILRFFKFFKKRLVTDCLGCEAVNSETRQIVG